MVKKQQKKYGWEFIFIGANIDAYAEAQKIGVRRERTVNYVADAPGTAKVYAGVSEAVCKSLRIPDFLLKAELDESNWAEEINEDFNRRGNARRSRR